jgi:hypothetical protein
MLGSRIAMTSFRILWLFALVTGAHGAQPLPIFDAHAHYNAEAIAAGYSTDRVFELWRKVNIRGALVNSRPNDGTVTLYQAKQHEVHIVPFLRPYVVQADRYTWFKDPAIYRLIETELQRGIYRGIGEFHLFGDDARSDLVKRIVDLAAARNLMLHAHSDAAAVDILCAHNPKVRIMWAHSGFTSPPEEIERYFERYPTLLGELSYRYDMVSGRKLTPAWRRLLIKYADRFVVGTDTWVNQRWEEVPQTIAFYRGWLAELPPEVAEKIAYRNGERLFADR